MKAKEALTILTEIQKWRRAEPPYNEPNTMPFTPEQYGKALDVAINKLKEDDL